MSVVQLCSLKPFLGLRISRTISWEGFLTFLLHIYFHLFQAQFGLSNCFHNRTADIVIRISIGWVSSQIRTHIILYEGVFAVISPGWLRTSDYWLSFNLRNANLSTTLTFFQGYHTSCMQLCDFASLRFGDSGEI